MQTPEDCYACVNLLQTNSLEETVVIDDWTVTCIKQNYWLSISKMTTTFYSKGANYLGPTVFPSTITLFVGLLNQKR